MTLLDEIQQARVVCLQKHALLLLIALNEQSYCPGRVVIHCVREGLSRRWRGRALAIVYPHSFAFFVQRLVLRLALQGGTLELSVEFLSFPQVVLL